MKPSAGAGRYSGQEVPTRPVEKSDIIEGLLRSMQREVQDGFAAAKADIGKLNLDVHHLVEDQRLMRDRVGHLEQRVQHGSGRIRAVTSTEEELARSLSAATQKSASLEAELLSARERLDNVTGELADAKKVAEETKTIAAEAKKVAEETKTLAVDTKKLTVEQSAELEKQTAILNRLSTIAAHPVVKDLARTGGTAIVTALTTYFALRGH